MKIIYMYDTILHIRNILGEEEEINIISKGKIIEREDYKPYLLIENDTKKEGKKI